MGPVEMEYEFSGHLNHGCLYAANSFLDPKTQKQVVWGWITEEDLCDDLRHAEGWSGLLSMPRALRLMTMHSASGSDISFITSIEKEEDDHGSYTIRTLASQPYEPLVQSLRQASSVQRADLSRATLHGESSGVALPLDSIQTRRWELEAIFEVSANVHNIGLSLDHSGDF